MLRGVNSGLNSLYDLDAVKNGWVLNFAQPASLDLRNHKPAFTLHAPRPHRLLALLRVHAPNLITSDSGALISDKIATAHVLLYKFNDENQVLVDGHEWEPYSIGDAISLHIIASPQGEFGIEHQMHTNHTLKAIIRHFPGIKIASPPAAPLWRFPMDPNSDFGLDPIDPRNPDPDRLQPCPHPGLKDCLTTSGNNPAFAFSLQELEDFPLAASALTGWGGSKNWGDRSPAWRMILTRWVQASRPAHYRPYTSKEVSKWRMQKKI